MLECHICEKPGNYAQMIDYTVYSVHPQCEAKINNNIVTNSESIYHFKKGISSCPIREINNNIHLSELRNHLMNQHIKKSLVDRILAVGSI
jgi:hypothetical protein